MKQIFALFILFALAGCSSPPPATPPVIHQIECNHWINQCYYKARDRCLGKSYKVLRSAEHETTGGPWERQKTYKISITCGS